MLIGCSLSLLPDGPTRINAAQFLAAASLTVSLLALLGYLFGGDLQHVAFFSSIVIDAVIVFLVLGAGLLAIRGNQGWISVFIQATDSAKMSRRFILVIIVALPVIAYVRVIGQRDLNLFGTYFGVAILSVTSIVMLVTLNWFNTRSSTRSERAVARINEQLADMVNERTSALRASNESLVLAREDAERADSAKTAFLSSMSHEFRTPLNAILGFGQVLASDTLPSTPVQRKEFANHILKSGRHLLSLINDILDLVQVETGNLVVSMEVVALAELLQDCRAMVEPLARKRGLRRTFEWARTSRTITTNAGMAAAILPGWRAKPSRSRPAS